MNRVELSKRRLPMEQLAQLITLQLESGGRANLTVTGSSMLPMLRNGVDAVELIHCPYRFRVYLLRR